MGREDLFDLMVLVHHGREQMVKPTFQFVTSEVFWRGWSHYALPGNRDTMTGTRNSVESSKTHFL